MTTDLKVTQTQKKQISWMLKMYVARFSSVKKASETISDCSEATIVCMISETEFCWEKISDAMWRNVMKQIDDTANYARLVETQNFQTLLLYFSIAREEGASFSIVGNAGWGKSFTAKWYAQANRKNHVYYLECAEYWTKSVFLRKLLNQMGKNGNGMGNPEMMDTIIREIRRQHQPLIILDEIDKLPDPVLKFYITLYNDLNKSCGFVWLSTDAIEKRIMKGQQLNTIGYKEIFSRIGASFINLNMPSVDEIREICESNDITDPEELSAVVNEVRQIGGDLRRVDRNILKRRVKKGRKQLKSAA